MVHFLIGIYTVGAKQFPYIRFMDDFNARDTPLYTLFYFLKFCIYGHKTHITTFNRYISNVYIDRIAWHILVK